MVLKIDVDGTRKLSRRELERRARIAHVTIVRVVDTRSPSGRGWHRVFEVEWGQDHNRAVRRDGAGSSSANMSRGARDRCARASTAGNIPKAVKGIARVLPCSALEVVALQLLFGSDPIREAFNLHRARLVDAGQVSAFWRKRWNTLYATSGGRESLGVRR